MTKIPDDVVERAARALNKSRTIGDFTPWEECTDIWQQYCLNGARDALTTIGVGEMIEALEDSWEILVGRPANSPIWTLWKRLDILLEKIHGEVPFNPDTVD